MKKYTGNPERGVNRFGLEVYTETIEERLRFIESCIETGLTILDLGCGTGASVTEEIFSAIPSNDLANVEYIGIDISQEYIDKAQANLGDLGLGRIELIVSDISSFGQDDLVGSEKPILIIMDDFLQWNSHDTNLNLLKELRRRFAGTSCMISSTVLSIWNPMCISTSYAPYLELKPILDTPLNKQADLLPQAKGYNSLFPNKPYVVDIKRITGKEGQLIVAYSEEALRQMLSECGIENSRVSGFNAHNTPNGLFSLEYHDHLHLRASW